VMKSSGTSSLAPTGLLAPPLSGKITSTQGGRRTKRSKRTKRYHSTRKA
jgi:hypothetical protein